MDKNYTLESIKLEISLNKEKLFSIYIQDKPNNWSCCERTKEFICIGEWLKQELIELQLDDVARYQQEGIFHRESRSQDDLYSLVYQIITDTLNGNIDRNRKPLRRWG